MSSMVLLMLLLLLLLLFQAFKCWGWRMRNAAAAAMTEDGCENSAITCQWSAPSFSSSSVLFVAEVPVSHKRRMKASVGCKTRRKWKEDGCLCCRIKILDCDTNFFFFFFLLLFAPHANCRYLMSEDTGTVYILFSVSRFFPKNSPCVFSPEKGASSFLIRWMNSNSSSNERWDSSRRSSREKRSNESVFICVCAR